MRKLEVYKVFPVVFLFLILGFIFYAYMLSTDIEDDESLLSNNAKATEAALEDPMNIQ